MTDLLHDGLDGRGLFDGAQGLTYEDFILLPGHIDFGVEEVSLETRFSRRIPLKAPIVSSPSAA